MKAPPALARPKPRQLQSTHRAKASKPHSDMTSLDVDSPSKEEAFIYQGISGSSALGIRQESTNKKTIETVQRTNTGRETTGSLTPLPSDTDEQPAISRGPISRQKDKEDATAKTNSSTDCRAPRTTPRTYAKARASKMVKTQPKSLEQEEYARGHVMQLSESAKKRKADEDIQQDSKAKRNRTGEPAPLHMARHGDLRKLTSANITY